ncbi:hypothetical protein SNEBB_010872 [Seison nebaliae]|nr:hypothetical protein SNEBB_010872 [Seison nebaliae]
MSDHGLYPAVQMYSATTVASSSVYDGGYYGAVYNNDIDSIGNNKEDTSTIGEITSETDSYYDDLCETYIFYSKGMEIDNGLLFNKYQTLKVLCDKLYRCSALLHKLNKRQYPPEYMKPPTNVPPNVEECPHQVPIMCETQPINMEKIRQFYITNCSILGGMKKKKGSLLKQKDSIMTRDIPIERVASSSLENLVGKVSEDDQDKINHTNELYKIQIVLLELTCKKFLLELCLITFDIRHLNDEERLFYRPILVDLENLRKLVLWKSSIDEQLLLDQHVEEQRFGEENENEEYSDEKRTGEEKSVEKKSEEKKSDEKKTNKKNSTASGENSAVTKLELYFENQESFFFNHYSAEIPNTRTVVQTADPNVELDPTIDRCVDGIYRLLTMISEESIFVPPKTESEYPMVVSNKIVPMLYGIVEKIFNTLPHDPIGFLADQLEVELLRSEKEEIKSEAAT